MINWERARQTLRRTTLDTHTHTHKHTPFTSAAISSWDKWRTGKRKAFGPELSRAYEGSCVHPGRLHWRPKINTVLYTSSIYPSTSPTIYLLLSSAVSHRRGSFSLVFMAVLLPFCVRRLSYLWGLTKRAHHRFVNQLHASPTRSAAHITGTGRSKISPLTTGWFGSKCFCTITCLCYCNCQPSQVRTFVFLEIRLMIDRRSCTLRDTEPLRNVLTLSLVWELSIYLFGCWTPFSPPLNPAEIGA